MISALLAGEYVVRVELPDAVHPVRLSSGAAVDEGVADELVRAVHPGLFSPDGDVLPDVRDMVAAATARYRLLAALRRESGLLMVAVCAGFLDGAYSASTLTMAATSLDGDDPSVAAAGIARALVADGPPDAEVIPLALPAGPAVGRVRRRAVHGEVAGESATLDIGLVDVHVPVSHAGALLVLELMCPTVDTFEAHAALAGEVARTIRVDARVDGAA